MAIFANEPAPARVPEPTDNPWPLGLLRTPAFACVVYGEPAPQGSKNARAIYRGKGESRQFTGKVAMHESSKKVAPWRQAVAASAKVDALCQGIDSDHLLDGALVADMVFTMPRGTTLPKWRDWHFTKPDLSKLARSTEDALSGVVWADDARLTAYRRLEKRYVGSDDPDTLWRPGVVIRVWSVPEHLIEDRKDRGRRRAL